jgi:magnesium transporter
MAEKIDVAQNADARATHGSAAQGSLLDHLPMRDEEGQLRHEFVEEIAGAIHAATGRCCARWWRNFTKPISAI